MQRFAMDKTQAKGWLFGPWNSEIPVPVGYANESINEEHYHEHMFEIHLVARGKSVLHIGVQELEILQGDALVVEPGEDHTFLSSSEDYLHFVIQAPFVQGDKILK